MNTTAVSFPREKMKILLLEGIHPVAVDKLESSGYRAELKKGAMSESELREAIRGVHLLGIRSKTQVTARVFEEADHLLGVGCFCIGTDQVDLEAAAGRGVPVFNAPFSNTRSVAELALAEIVMLARKAAHKSALMHSGVWDKSADGCIEVRNKTLGIVGYGHIGPQVGILAEAFGMKVLFYDVTGKLPLGNATPMTTLEELLKHSDFVTLHVPETPDTRGMIGKHAIATMKKGSYLLNLSRGSVVDVEALKEGLESGHLAGAGVDVFPAEPANNDEPFHSSLRGLPNTILTPHIGGSTIEAQRNIGLEVIGSLLKFTENGSTSGSVNFPQVELPVVKDCDRILNIHKNVPGVLGAINSIIAQMGANIRGQYLNTRGEIGYLIIDVERGISHAVKNKLEELDTNIRSRLLF